MASATWGEVSLVMPSIALAVVVGADVEDGVVLTVVPAYEPVVFLDEGEEVVARLSHLAALLHLCQEPRAGDDGMGLEQLAGSTWRSSRSR